MSPRTPICSSHGIRNIFSCPSVASTRVSPTLTLPIRSFTFSQQPSSAPSAVPQPISHRLFSSTPSSHSAASNPPLVPPFSLAPSYNNILTRLAGKKEDVAVISLNRPKALNALSSELMGELNDALAIAQKDPQVGCIVLTGSGQKAFAAGADIKEMKSKSFSEGGDGKGGVYTEDFLKEWTKITDIVRKPVVAAVNGFALGGGCELAMMCDIILAAPNAVFGQPEINLGVIPGAGGTQRLLRTVGKSLTMELVLTGRNFSAKEAESWGLISKIVGEGEPTTEDTDLPVLKEAISMAETIAGKGRVAVMAGKEAVNAANELSLAQGLNFERRLFHSLFATHDQREGMDAFASKRKAEWKNA